MIRAWLLLAFCGIAAAQPGHWLSNLADPYRAPRVPPVNLRNSPRIGQLVRAGILYLSLPDAVALAIENNLDVEFERFLPRIAESDILRTEGGGTPRGISLSTFEVPPGVGGPPSPLLNVAASGSLPGSSVSSSLTVLNAITPTQSGINITGAAPLSAGPPVPQFDPALTGSLVWQHQNMPEVSTLASGGNSLSGSSVTGNLGLTKGFSTGTQLTVGFNAEDQHTNAASYRLNPNTTANLNLTLVQPLLRGFGPAVNRRFIRIAKNNQQTSALVFRQQLIATVAGIIRLYDDLVSLGEDAKVKQETLALAQRLYEDNRVQVEQGTLAPVELTRAEAQVAAAQQDLANSQGYLRQQELIVKTVLTRRGTADPLIREARLQTTTPIEIPGQEPARDVEGLIAEAMRGRPELGEARLQIENSHIALEGSRNELLPELNIVATGQNASLAGQPNALAPAGAGAQTGAGAVGPVGGLGTDLSQVFSGRYPTYSVGIELNLPLRNRVAQADVARDEIQVRQWALQQQQLENQVRLEVEGSVIALQQARAAYDAAVRSRQLQEQSLNIELEKFSVGISTSALVMQYQSYLAQARSTEVAARNVYVKAQVALERAVGSTLETNGITVDEALRGKISR